MKINNVFVNVFRIIMLVMMNISMILMLLDDIIPISFGVLAVVFFGSIAFIVGELFYSWIISPYIKELMIEFK